MAFNWPTEELTISGRVGIGTDTPSKELDVIGTISATNLNLSGSASAAQFVGNGSSLTGLVTTTGNSIIDGSLTINQNLAVSGNFQLGGNLQFTTGLAINEFSGDGNLTDSSNSAIPTEQAVKTYVDHQISQVNNTLATKASLNGDAAENFAAKTLTLQNDLKVLGNFEVDGTTTFRNIEQHQGDIELGNEDTDIVRMHGVLRSTHSSGALKISSAVDIDSSTNPVNLQVNGIVKATAFQGNGANLSGLVKKAGDTLTGPLKINDSLTVSGNVGIGTTSSEAPLNIESNEKNRALKITAKDKNTKIFLHVANENENDYGYLGLGGDTKLRGNGRASTFSGNLAIVSDGWTYLDVRCCQEGEDAVIRLYDGVKGSNSEHYWSIHNDDSAGNKLDIRSNNSSRMSLTTDGDLTVNGNLTISGTLMQEDWRTPTLQNGWVSWDSSKYNSFNSAGYFKDCLGIVHLKGIVDDGDTNTVIFTLPVGYRPSNIEVHVVLTRVNKITTGWVRIYPNGNLKLQPSKELPSGKSDWVSLDGITFRAAR